MNCRACGLIVKVGPVIEEYASTLDEAAAGAVRHVVEILKGLEHDRIEHEVLHALRTLHDECCMEDDDRMLNVGPMIAPSERAVLEARYALTRSGVHVYQSPPAWQAGKEPPVETRAGDCKECGGPVFHRPGKPGEYDHACSATPLPDREAKADGGSS